LGGSILLWAGLERGLALPLRRRGASGQRLAGWAVLGLGIGCGLVMLAASFAYRTARETQPPAHRLAGEWLRQNARPGDIVVAHEIGMISFFSGLRTVDTLGLTAPEALPY